MALPRIPVQRPEELTEYNVLIFGEKGAGKTLTAASFPKTFTFRFERGRRNLSICQHPVPLSNGKMPRLTWMDFVEKVEEFINDDYYERMVVDTLDQCAERCLEWACEQFDVSEPREAKKPADVWICRTSALQTVWNAVTDAGKKITFLTHWKKETVKDPLGRHSEEEIITVSCSASPYNTVREMVDFAWFLQNHGEDRILTVRSNDGSEITSQVPERFITPEGESLKQILIPKLPEDYTTEEMAQVYEQIEKGWNNELSEYLPPEERAEEERKKRVAARKAEKARVKKTPKRKVNA